MKYICRINHTIKPLDSLEMSSNLVLRQPLFSHRRLFQSENQTYDLKDLVSAFLRDRNFLYALFWSSPTFFQTVEKFRNNDPDINSKKIEQAVAKYVLRAVTRPTPYGAFAGAGQIGAGLKKSFYGIQKSSLSASPDAQLMEDLKNSIVADNSFKSILNYGLNNTIYIKNNEFRFLSYQNGEYKLTSLQSTEILSDIYALRGDTFLLKDIRKIVGQEYNEEDVERFLRELLDLNFIFAEIPENINKKNDLDVWDVFAKSLSDTQLIKAVEIKSLITGLSQLSSSIYQGEIYPKATIDSVYDSATELGLEVNNILNLTAKICPGKVEPLSELLLKDLKLLTGYLYNIFDNSRKDSDLSVFKNKFTAVYEDSIVPLLEVLDPELGLGFPVKSGFGTYYSDDFLNVETASETVSIKNGFQQNWLTTLIEENTDKKKIILTKNDLPDKSNIIFPSTFNIIGTQCKDNQFSIQSIGGSSAKSILGRFAFDDEDIEKLCNDLACFEQQQAGDSVLAEINFLSNGKTGNIVRRPQFSKYSIDIFCLDNNKNSQSLPLSDLMVAVRNNEVILLSKSLNKRIIPKLSNAHNYNNISFSLYTFLSSLQQSSGESAGYDPLQLADNRSFLPRITYKNTILCRMTWILTEKDIQRLFLEKLPAEALTNLASKLELPQFICITENDQELFIDLHNRSYVELMLAEIKNKTKVVLTEYLQDTEQKFSHSSSYINQIIIPVKNHSPKQYRQIIQDEASPDVKKKFPGSEWIYFKIYCPSAYADELLIHTIRPLLLELYSEQHVSKGFFIRYNDPDHHLRFRVKLHMASDFQEVLNKILSSLHTVDFIWKFDISTYDREVERYGIKYIDDIENCFFYDTIMILNTLSDLDLFSDNTYRILLAVRNIDEWLKIYALDTAQKLRFCIQMEELFFKEFNYDIKREIYAKYREYSGQLTDVMSDSNADIYFIERKMHVSKLIISVESISDIIHMSINRWFPENQRVYEYLVYIFAVKYYRSVLNSKSKIV